MVKASFSTGWKRSTQVRKQRKYRYNAPLHTKQKLMHVHLTSALREKHGFRNVQVRKGDKVKVLRGQFKGKEGKVERVSLKHEKVFITGLEVIKKEGTKILFPLSPSNLMIIELDMSDRKRKAKLQSKKSKKAEKKEEVKEEKTVKETPKEKEEKK